jgi:diacylglycerol kinase (ATP)
MAFEPLNLLVRATIDSLIGLRDAFRSEPAFRQELSILIPVYPCRPALNKNGRGTRFANWKLVGYMVEMVNSAIEATIDCIGRKSHELSRKANDFGSAAIFCSIVLSEAVWILVLLPG